MAGSKGRSGRNSKIGEVYRFTFYYRWIPGQDPPELKTLLQTLAETNGRKRRDILQAALLGGAQRAWDVAAKSEDSEDSTSFDEMFANF